MLRFGAIQSFQRDRFICQPIERFVHDAHAAGAEFAAQTEAFSPAKFFSCFDHGSAMLLHFAILCELCVFA